MKHLSQRSNLSYFSTVAGVLISGTMLLTGCGIGGDGAVATQPINVAPAQGSGIKGILHGGPSPIAGANVILWATQSAGYPSSTNDTTGTTSLQLATATTNSQGAFSFNPVTNPYTCPAGQFAYITSTGGNSGTYSNNSQITLMAALGSCSNFSSTSAENNINIMMNEVTTVAAAYALGNFMYVNDNGGTGNQLVYVSAPANNNAATGSCTGTGSSMTCTAAGLAHAFANAANLVDAVHYDGSTPTGTPYSAPPSNTAYGSVPQAEINTLANVLQYCTNSASSGTNGVTPSGNCATLFSDTTVSTSQSTTGTSLYNPPVDELQAMLNIVKAPANNVSGIFALTSSETSFQNGLNTAPNDWSLAVTYAPASTGNSLTAAVAITGYSITGNVVTFTASNTLKSGEQVYVYGFPTSTFLNGVTYIVSSTGLSGTQFEAPFTYATTSAVTENGSALLDYPIYLALDANDNVYAASQDGTSLEGGMSALASNGAINWSNQMNYNFCSPYMVATDVNSRAWMSSSQGNSGCSTNGTSGEGDFIISFNTSSGTTGSFLFGETIGTAGVIGTGESGTNGIAFDRSSDLFFNRNTTCSSGGSACIYYYKYSSNTYPTTWTKPTAAEDADLSGGGALMIDSNYNVWMTNTSTSTTGTAYVSVFPNSGSDASPAWANAVISSALPEGKNLGIAMDGTSNHNLWAASYNGTSAFLSSFLPTYGGTSGDDVTAIGAASNTTINATQTPTNPYQGEFDGVGTYWFPNNATSGYVYYFVPSTGNSIALKPCFLPAAATTCGSSTNIGTAGGRVAQVDSTGSVWVAATTGGQIVQIIGSAAPSWPQLSYAVFGAEPQ